MDSEPAKFADGCAYLHLLPSEQDVRGGKSNASKPGGRRHRTASESSTGAGDDRAGGLALCVSAYSDPESILPALGSPLYRSWEQLEFDPNADPTMVLGFGLNRDGAPYAKDAADVEDRLRGYLQHPRAAAVGVASLGFTDAEPDDAKKVELDLVVLQARLARECGFPLLLQVGPGTGAFAAAIVRKHCEPDAKVLLHGWAAEPDVALGLVRDFPNVFIGFTGAVTFQKSKRIHELAFDCPLDRVRPKQKFHE